MVAIDPLSPNPNLPSAPNPQASGGGSEASLKPSPSLKAAPGLNRSPSLKAGPGLNRSPSLKAGPGLNRSPSLKDGPGLNRSPSLKDGPSLNRSPSLKASPSFKKSPSFKVSAIPKAEDSPRTLQLRDPKVNLEPAAAADGPEAKPSEAELEEVVAAVRKCLALQGEDSSAHGCEEASSQGPALARVPSKKDHPEEPACEKGLSLSRAPSKKDQREEPGEKGPSLSRMPSKKEQREERALLDACKQVGSISTWFRHLPPHSQTAFISGARLETFGAKRTVFRQGEEATKFYIVLKGWAEVKVIDQQRNVERATVVAVLGGGQTFGDLALIAHVPRNATVVTATPCDLLALPKQAFLDLVVRNGEVYDTANLDSEVLEQRWWRRHVGCTQGVADHHLTALTRAASVFRFERGHEIPVGATTLLYFLKSGAATLLCGGKVLTEVKEGQFIGEASLFGLNQGKWVAKMQSAVECLVIPHLYLEYEVPKYLLDRLRMEAELRYTLCAPRTGADALRSTSRAWYADLKEKQAEENPGTQSDRLFGRILRKTKTSLAAVRSARGSASPTGGHPAKSLNQRLTTRNIGPGGVPLEQREIIPMASRRNRDA